MDQNVVAYLQQNKSTYSREVLVEQLSKAGYSDADIAEGAVSVYGEPISAGQGVRQPNGFWDFNTPKKYSESSEKWKDFLFGFFAPWIVGILLGILVPIIGSLIAFVLFIAGLVYFFSRRRYIFYGMLAEMVALPILVLVIMSSFLG